MNTAKYKFYTVMIDNFGHDGNGNVIARHTVFGNDVKPKTNDGFTLYQTKRRQQVGYNDKRNEWARSALAKAGAPDGMPVVSTSGSRSEDCIFIVYKA